jgi:signal peptidase I
LKSPCDAQAKPALFVKKGEGLSLSGQLLKELLKSALDKGASFRFRSRGFSMSPFIKDGDVVTVTPLWAATPGLGDVVVFTHPRTGKLVIHRVVGKRPDSYLIKGDNFLEGDGFVPKANILGHVAGVERDGNEVFLSLGLERFLIAFLTRRGLLPLLFPVYRFVRLLIRRSVL